MRRIIMASITAVVVIAVLAGTLIPVLDDATASSDTLTNEGLIGMNKYGTDTDITIFWDHTNPTVVTVNGTEVAIPQTTITASTGYEWLVRYQTNVVTFFYVTNVQASVADGTDLTVTMSNGSVTATNTASTPVTATTSYEEVFVVATGDDYDYVMKASTDAAYLNGDSEIVASGMSAINGVGGYGYTITGTINDGLVVDQFRGADTTNSTPVLNVVEDGDHIDLYKLDYFTFTANTTTLTWNQFIVPHEVTAERSVHFNDNENAIFNAIPVIVIIALLLAVVAMVLRSRMD